MSIKQSTDDLSCGNRNKAAEEGVPFDCDEDVRDAILFGPILLEGIDANLAFRALNETFELTDSRRSNGIMLTTFGWNMLVMNQPAPTRLSVSVAAAVNVSKGQTSRGR